MLGMSLTSFVTLTVIGAVVAAVYYYVLRYRFLEGIDAVFGKMLLGWLGAWLGSPVLGHWLWRIDNVYIVPAICGAIAAIHLNTLTWKAMAKLAGTRAAVAPATEKFMKAAA